jgi:hypothetical protein
VTSIALAQAIHLIALNALVWALTEQSGPVHFFSREELRI